MPRRGSAERALKMLIHDWSKRILKPPADYNGDTTRFLFGELARVEFLAIESGPGPESTGFARELKNVAFDVAISGLYGCTTVVVVSESAMWISHFWEVPAFRATPAH